MQNLPNKGDYAYHMDVAWQQKYTAMKKYAEALENGSAIDALKKKHERAETSLRAQIRKLKKEILQEQKERERVRNHWMRINDDLQEEHEKEIAKLQAAHKRDIQKLERELEKEREKRIHADEEGARWRRMYNDEKKAHYETETKLELAEEASAYLRAQMQLDSETCGLPSSMDKPGQKKQKKRIANSRVKTERKPGAQPEHEGHGRKMPDPTDPPVYLPLPADMDPEIWDLIDDGDSRREVELLARIRVRDVKQGVYCNRLTGEIRRIPFPADMPNEVNYGPGVAAAFLMLTEHCNVAARKAREFMEDVSGGTLSVSHGWIAGLSAKFSRLSEPDRRQIFADIVAEESHVGWDATVKRVNGKSECAAVSVTDTCAYHTYSQKKGSEAFDLHPVKYTKCAVITDGEKTSDKYVVGRHQRCDIHISRELKRVILEAPKRQWCERMLTLIEQMIHKVHIFEDREEQEGRKVWFEPGELADLRQQYDRICEDGLAEYEYEPASQYEHDHVVLLDRLIREKEMNLYFLDHPGVPFHNNAAERALRPQKRRQNAKVTNRSGQSVSYYCDFLTIIQTEQLRDRSPYAKVHEIFSREHYYTNAQT